MTKAERLNDMLLYLNDKKSFHLKNIMERYSISKSTALRDIQSLEEIGMPIYSKIGRNGYYGILPNRLLSPIVFTIDEVYALYFSMQTLTAYQSTPFHMSIVELKQKFESCISEKRREELRKMESIFRLGNYQNKKECSCLKDLLQTAIEENVCKISYQKGDTEKSYDVQFYDILSAYGQWYATGYCFQSSKPQVFRCDKIQSIQLSKEYTAKLLTELIESSGKLLKHNAAIQFEVGITTQGADLFYKEHYPSMTLYSENGDYSVRGFYNPGEETFIAHYFSMYRETILSIQPPELKQLIVERLDALKNYISSLPE